MPLNRRLRLDEVVSSFPELGPTVPDGGYAWIVLFGVFLVQVYNMINLSAAVFIILSYKMKSYQFLSTSNHSPFKKSVPSILAMYGIVLAYLHETKGSDFSFWDEEIVLTPILFAAFWNLADPWTRMIVSMASVPRLLGMTGVILLSAGITASGYLATGGVGAYLASTTAGIIMGIGASLVTLLSDYILRKYFRKRLLIALTVRNVGASFGLVLIPCITNLLLQEARLKTGLQLITSLLLPTALGTLTFRIPPQQQAPPYRLLLSTEEDTELPIRVSSSDPKDLQQPGNQDGIGGTEYDQLEDNAHCGGLLNDGSNMYAYEELDEDVDLFVNPVCHTNGNKWEHQFRGFKSFQFWAAAVGWFGMKVSILFFWLLLPVLSYEIVRSPNHWIWSSLLAGFCTFLPNLLTYKVLTLTNQNRRFYFGAACWVFAISVIGILYANNYTWMLLCISLGGLSIGSLSCSQDLALYDVLGYETVCSVHKGLSTVVGVSMLIFCFVHSISLCLLLAATLQFLGGLYWIASPALNLIKTIRYRSRAMNRMSRDDT